MSERQIQNQILREFGTRRDMRLWRTNSGVAKLHGQAVRFGVVGQADLHGILPGGLFLAVEVKSEIGKQSAEQLAYQAMVGKFGGVYVLARSVQDVHRALNKYLLAAMPQRVLGVSLLASVDSARVPKAVLEMTTGEMNLASARQGIPPRVERK